MNKLTGIVAFLFLFALASIYAQITDFEKIVSDGTPQSIQDAINQGADVNAIDKQGWTPLLMAAANNPNPDVITTLLKAGAPLHPAYGWIGTALMAAASGNKNPEVITTLLKAGEDINARDINGMTPLMYAADNNPNPDVIITLLKAGANPAAMSNEGKTAYDYALMSGLLGGTDALRQLGQSQPGGMKLLSTDGHFTLYIPRETASLTAEQVSSNKALFALMESQVKHRPVMVRFSKPFTVSFIRWMLAEYGNDLAPYWGRNEVGAEATASYFLDRTEDNDFVIDVRFSYSSQPGTEIVVMTYEYFMATH